MSTIRRVRAAATLAAAAALTLPALALGQAFKVEESTIDGMQKAIQDRKITCQEVVQAYLDRAKAYNGSCTALVTADGKPIAPVKARKTPVILRRR